ncbi:hypothetical protein AYO22_06310 [Fonsecaea multimorphosa]|nr:hypothetical protein AYO22_06310 [Fonsecaea multimorphosa]
MEAELNGTVSWQSESANGLETARKALLDKADWVGLATVRPLKFDQHARDDIKGLGRRRKIAQLKKSRPMSQKNSDQRKLGSTRPALDVPSLRTEEISLRIGSNIHQTQTTPSIVVCKEPIHPAERAMDELVPPENRWGKKATGNTGDEARKGSSDKNQARACGPSRGATAPLDSPNEHNLIGLNEAVALGLTSWDKVRVFALSGIQRSVSISSASSTRTSPNPLGTEVDVHRKQGLCQQDEALAISDGSYGHISPQVSTPVLPDIIHRVIAVGILKDRPGQKLSPSSFLEPALHPDHTLTPSRSLAEESIPVTSDVTYKYDVALGGQVAPHPQFTLDDQVKLERTVKELEWESQQARESSPAADKMGHNDTIDSLWFPNNISTSDVGFASDSDLSGFASVFSSNENEFPSHHHPVTRATGVYTKCITKEQQSRPEEVPNLITSETGCFLNPDGVGKAPLWLTDCRPGGPLALRKGEQVDQTSASQRPVTSNTRQNIDMDNEAWMRYVFPGNFDQTQDVFHFQGGAVPPKSINSWPDANLTINKPSCSRHDISGAWVERKRSGSAPRVIDSPNSIPTAVNTPIFVPTLPYRDHSETDFLSQLSPMEGHFDERLRDISLYNNAPETDLEIDISPSGSLHTFGDGASRNLPGSLVPAKRKALDPLRERASSGWLRSIDRSSSKSLPLPHGQPSVWSFSDSGGSANTVQDSIEPTSKRRSAAARPHQSTAFQKPVDKFGQTQTLVQGSLKRSEQAWTAARGGEPPGRSGKLTADSSPSRSCRTTRSTIKNHARTASFQLWSGVPTAPSTPFASLESANTQLSPPVPPVILLRRCKRNNPITNIHAPQPLHLVRAPTHVSTQIRLWSEGQ